MKHVDLFSGIGGFALATDWAFEGVEHIFCEIDPFCQKILKKHWPKAKIHDDIKQFKADNLGRVDLLTGGFPCQPFSVAGEQRAQDDDRHLWPEMFRIVKECRPSWIIGENVAGIIELALEQVCLDLESEGYEVWPIVIPACAVNAPHRRDRVWIIGYAKHARLNGSEDGEGNLEGINGNEERASQICELEGSNFPRAVIANHDNRRKAKHEKQAAGYIQYNSDATNPEGILPQRQRVRQGQRESGRDSWLKNWMEVATEFCSVDDGLPAELDGLKLSKSRNRAEQLKAYGNAIVPQVAYEIIKLLPSAERSKELTSEKCNK